MTERERLIELIGDYTEDKSARDIHSAEFEEQFADYLLENGVVVPPVKVGDTVYSYSKEFDTVLAYFVEEIKILYDTDNKCGLWVHEANCVETGDLIDSIDFYSEDIGKTVFLARKEAEKALHKINHNSLCETETYKIKQ